MHVHFTVDGWFCSRIPSGLCVSIVSSACSSLSLLRRWCDSAFAISWYFRYFVISWLFTLLVHPIYSILQGGGVTSFAAISECCSESVISEQSEQRKSSACSSFVKFAFGYERILIVNTYVYIILANALRVARLQVNIAPKYCRELASVASTCANDHSTIILYVCASFLAAAAWHLAHIVPSDMSDRFQFSPTEIWFSPQRPRASYLGYYILVLELWYSHQGSWY